KRAKDHLENYLFSSYLSYRGKARKEDNILSKKEFPDYFSHRHDFEDFIDEWLTFNTYSIQDLGL
ncbi:MAG: hypothetical protein B7X03_03260, partial [Parcubacteria group bacterium 21-58-10]